MYVVPALLALGRVRTRFLGWILLGAALASFIGLRYQVGTDWGNYLRGYYYPAGTATFVEALTRSDPFFFLLNWLANSLALGVWFVNFIVAVIFCAGLIRFVRRMPEPLIAFTTAIPYLSLIVAMNYARQSAAIGLVLWALVDLYDGRLARYVGFIFIAALFHKSAILFVPLIVVYRSRNRLALFVMAGLMGVLGYLLVLAERFDKLWDQYVLSEYSQASQGAPVRVAMNALPAAVFLLLQHRFAIEPVARRVWTSISLASLAAMTVVFVAPTAVDRVALYFSPIQFVVAAYFIDTFRRDSRVAVRAVVIGVYAGVLYVWLVYAANAPNWFPYQIWPFLSEGLGPVRLSYTNRHLVLT